MRARRKARHGKVENSTNPQGQITLTSKGAKTTGLVELSTHALIQMGTLIIRAPKSPSTLYNPQTARTAKNAGTLQEGDSN